MKIFYDFMKIFRTQCLLSALIFLCQVKHEDILQWSLHDTFISEINKIFCRQTIIWITRPRKFHSILPCCDYLLHCKLSCMRGQQGKFNHCRLKPRPLALNLFPSLASHDKILWRIWYENILRTCNIFITQHILLLFVWSFEQYVESRGQF